MPAFALEGAPAQPSGPPSCAQASPKASPGARMTAADPQAAPSCSAPPPAAAAGAATDAERRQRQLAVLLLGGGRHQDALRVLQLLLARHPASPELLCLQGRCLAALGSRPQALASFAAALAEAPACVPALVGCAAVYKDSGLLAEALAALQQALLLAEPSSGAAAAAADAGGSAAESPAAAGGAAAAALGGCIPSSAADVRQALAVVMTDLGTHQKLAGQAGWRDQYVQAVAVCPGYAPAHYNLGVAAAEAGGVEEAVAHYTTAVELAPRYAEAWCNLGVTHKQQARLEVAIACYERALEASPSLEVVQLNLAAALTQHGTAIKAAGRGPEGIACYERALALAPRHAEALYNLGVAYTEQGHVDRALFVYQTALAVEPKCAEAHNNLGVLYRELGNMERAVQCYQAALHTRPNFPQGLNNLAVVYTQQGRAQEALQLLQAAIMAAPTYAEAHNNLGVLQRDVGAVHDAIASYQRCLDLDPTNRHAGQNLLLALNYAHHGDSRLVCEAHEEWGRRFQELHPQLPPLTAADVDTTEGRTLVVGYISPDLFTHSVSYFAEAPLAHHSSRSVRTIVYSCVPKPDAKTARLQAEVAAAGGTWRDVARLSEPELADLIRSDKVDILVELTGHTASNRLGAMARRPAPVQVSWIGYPNSTGLRSVDYRLTDSTCDPQGTAQTFTEELVRLAGCFLCYTPPPDAPPVAPLPAVTNGFVTFGSFNALAKQTPEVLSVWARILLAVPGSRLVLKNKPFACEAVRNKFWRVFEEAGVERSRVDLLPLAAVNRDHLAQYSLLDVALDPWPYAGTTTTAEALYMGVPCLTLAGACHAHNVGVSLLAAVGLQEQWVAHTVEAYIAKAAALASDFASLSELRRGLRARMLQSPLCDAPGFVARLEDTAAASPLASGVACGPMAAAPLRWALLLLLLAPACCQTGATSPPSPPRATAVDASRSPPLQPWCCGGRSLSTDVASDFLPMCWKLSYGLWAEDQATDYATALLPAELSYATIVLAADGVTLAALKPAVGSGTLWPLLKAPTQCACCKLCQAQGVAADGTPRCKRWSFRSADAACRLFAPPGAAVAPAAVQRASEAQNEWYSGTWESGGDVAMQLSSGVQAAVEDTADATGPQCRFLCTRRSIKLGRMCGMVHRRRWEGQ
ncbi:putative UDP-N-acetylglucosamine-peptide N-acetylglucosaminyltransferase SPINDLY [Micractinium conductrix]|uniref:protein O-GlcNAc transferase n=1 Tax=Micractinium conductrix TaxID=554055 RepID=A0A2P6VJW4_9CHLO|nr:putative UDP-N-acetylglucosamine-peptide N-acetylglucosaminyltransferase SPINDLY [Micractinium conductrix]|eukprot:PSC74350.1 putative UDP-N-acetylglucosamine-peptide N-acetylglucosaminyltransferase SPINDLY [Micractinium conductrix]